MGGRRSRGRTKKSFIDDVQLVGVREEDAR